jgi:hypothetical protein
MCKSKPNEKCEKCSKFQQEHKDSTDSTKWCYCHERLMNKIYGPSGSEVIAELRNTLVELNELVGNIEEVEDVYTDFLGGVTSSVQDIRDNLVKNKDCIVWKDDNHPYLR